MVAPTNFLQQVQTYQRSGLAFLENLNCFVGEVCNTKFNNFNEIVANLGSTVTYDRPPRFSSTNTLIASFEAAVQRVLPLTVDQAANTSFAFTAQERMFNVDKDTESYMGQFGKAAVKQLATTAETNIALNAISAMPVNNNAGVPTGALHTESGPYRCFGDGITPISSFQQLAQMIANFEDFGSALDDYKVVLPVTSIPAIIGNGLNQFVWDRNEDLAMGWKLGKMNGLPANYYTSNLLPVQNAGTVGNSQQTLTVISTNDPTGAAITSITLSGATANDPAAIKSGDILTFIHTSGYTDLRFMTFIGQSITSQVVQFRATANVAADGSGHVTIPVLPTFQSTPGATQNINTNIIAGMRATCLPTHRAGLLVGGNAFFLAIPALPSQPPFDTANEYDDETHVSMRMTYGSTFGQNQLGMVYDMIWGASLDPDYCMRIAFPM